MKVITPVLAFVLLMMCSLSLTAQCLQEKIYSIRDVEDIEFYHDTLWITTGGGIVLADLEGNVLKRFADDDSFERLIPTDLVKDKQGNLWMASANRAARYDGLHWEFIDKPNIFNAIATDSHGTLWVGSSSGLYKYTNGTWTLYDATTGLGNNFIKGVYVDTNDVVWVISTFSVSFFDGTKWTNLSNPSWVSPFGFEDINGDKDGNIWVTLGYGGIAKISAYTTWKHYSWEKNEVLFTIYDRITTSEDKGTLYFGAEGGYTVMQNGILTNYPTEHQANITFRDKNNHLWIGSEHLYIQQGQNWNEVLPKNEIKGNLIWKMIKGADGQYYIGTWTGYSILDNNREVIPQSKPFSSQFEAGVLDIAEEPGSGIFWFGTENGIFRYKDLTADYYPAIEIAQSTRINAIYVDKDKKKWAGTYGAGVTVFDDNTQVNYKEGDGLLSNYVYAFYQDANGAMWIGTLEGLNKFENGVISEVNIEDPEDPFPFPPTIYKILEHPVTGDIWMSSTFGLIKMHGDEITHVKDLNGARVWAAGDFQFDSKGNIWFVSWSGLYFFDHNEVKAYNESNGLDIDDIMSVLLEDDHNVWTGTWGAGINILHTYDPIVSDHAPAGTDHITKRDQIYTYTIAANENATDYTWQLTPASAGIITMKSNQCSIQWADNFGGTAQLTAVLSNCQEEVTSPALTITVDAVLGLAETRNSNVHIYPNPSEGTFKISMGNYTGNTSVKVSNMQGKIIYRTDAMILNEYAFSLKGLPAGIYFATITTSENTYNQKLVLTY